MASSFNCDLSAVSDLSLSDIMDPTDTPLLPPSLSSTPRPTLNDTAATVKIEPNSKGVKSESSALSRKKIVSPAIWTLKVALNERELEMKLNPTTKLKKLMAATCKHFKLEQNSVRFLFDGRRVNGEDTAMGMGMEDGDEVEVFQEQDGGT